MNKREIKLYSKPVSRIDAGTFMVVESYGSADTGGGTRRLKKPKVVFTGRHRLAERWIGWGIAESIANRGGEVGVITRKGDEVRLPIKYDRRR